MALTALSVGTANTLQTLFGVNAPEVNGALTNSLNRNQQPSQVPLTDVRTPTQTVPTTASAGVVGIAAGTFGTAGPTIVSEAGATKADIGRVQIKIPANLRTGGKVNLVFTLINTAAAQDGTLTVSGYYYGGGTISADLIAYPATVFNGLAAVAVTVPVTVTTLLPGQILDVEFTLSTATTGTISLYSISVLTDTNA